MPVYRDFTLTKYIKQVWELALQEDIVFDFPGTIEGRAKCANLYNLLTNHRKAVRRHKLNPIYSEEWERIQKVELRRASGRTLILTSTLIGARSRGRKAYVENSLKRITQEFGL